MKSLIVFSLFFMASAQAEIGALMVGPDADQLRVADLSYKSIIVGMRMQTEDELPFSCSSSWDSGSECMLRQVPVWKKTLVVTVEYNSDFDRVGADSGNESDRISFSERNASVDIAVPENAIPAAVISGLKKRNNRKTADALFTAKIELRNVLFTRTVYESCDYTSEGDAIHCRNPREITEPQAVKFITVDLKN